MGWKYVVLRGNLFEVPVIFPDKLVHKDVADHMQHLLNFEHEKSGPWSVVSAGLIEQLNVAGVGGDSETLGIESRGEDHQMINLYSYLHGIVT